MINCPSCGSSRNDIIYEIDNMPLSNMGLSINEKEAKLAKTSSFIFSMCLDCKLLYNKNFIPELVEYKTQLNTTYYINKPWLIYTKKSADHFREILKKYNSKKILEIGCGNGEFLNHLNRNKEFICEGYDPSLMDNFSSKSFKIIRDYFIPKKNTKKYDAIVIRHVIEHLEFPTKFLEDILYNIKSLCTDKVLFFLEVPNVKSTINDLRFNDLVYEHVSYFSIATFNNFLNRLNLKILFQTEALDDENLQAICLYENDDNIKIEVSNFKDNNSISEKYLSNFFEKNIEKNICFWGAGGRGVTLINKITSYLNPNKIKVTDSDERKFNKYLPICGFKIIDPNKINFNQIEIIIITTNLGKKGIIEEIKKIDDTLLKKVYVFSKGGLLKC